MNASVADSDATRKYRPWFAFFLPWVLSNEVFSHPRADTFMRLTWLKKVYFYFLLCNKTLRKKSSPQNITKYGCREDNSSRCCLFKSKILRNTTNTIAAILFDIAHLSASQSLSL
jgi:hypothetical protein